MQLTELGHALSAQMLAVAYSLESTTEQKEQRALSLSLCNTDDDSVCVPLVKERSLLQTD